MTEPIDFARYELRTTLADVRAARPERIYYAIHTCWWALHHDELYTVPGSSVGDPPGPGLPCCPRGSVLMMTHEGDFEGFLEAAERNPGHYGKHGLRAFEAALHGNVTIVGGGVVLHDGKVAPDGYPWSFRSWETYNRLLDAHDAAQR